MLNEEFPHQLTKLIYHNAVTQVASLIVITVFVQDLFVDKLLSDVSVVYLADTMQSIHGAAWYSSDG